MQAELDVQCENKMESKTCIKCSEVKSVIEFPKRENTCKKCKKLYNAQYYAQHREGLIQDSKQYYAEHVEEVRQHSKQYREANADIVKQRKKQYYAEHAEEVRQHVKQYSEQNTEKIKQGSKQYYIQHKEEIARKGKQYYEQHMEEISHRGKRYRTQNIDKIKQDKKQYYVRNAEEIKQHIKQYCVQNAEKIKVAHRQYYTENLEKVKQCQRSYRETLRGKEVLRVYHLKRGRLGYNPINALFENSHYHHLRHREETGEINNSIGIFIPKEIHKSVWHNGSTGYNMEIINSLALEWYLKNTPTEEINPVAAKLYSYYQSLGFLRTLNVQ